MYDEYNAIISNPEACREIGKRLIFESGRTPEKLQKGLYLLQTAVTLNDAEAQCIIGKFFLDGLLQLKSYNSTEYGLTLLCKAANNGYLNARILLNSFCDNRYKKSFSDSVISTNHPLTDFDGKEIKINRKGIFTPIDAKLEYKNNTNILTLSANVSFLCDEYDFTDFELFKTAIISGFEAWSGEYTVFGGQKIIVKVEITDEFRVFDNVFVIPVTDELKNNIYDVWDKYGIDNENTKIAKDTLESENSFATVGYNKWSVYSRKIIFIQSDNGKFYDYPDIKDVAKHEFGHALGLGDLYASDAHGYIGVEKGTYKDIDSYYISDRIYNLTMCDYKGPISNNDIEMVLLAFSSNRVQNYQVNEYESVVSEALGKGN